MHSEDIESLENATSGERTLLRFLREAARRDSNFIGWYGPAIGEQGRESDFVFFGNQQSLLFLEVEDWLIDRIEEADSHNFKVRIGGREENKTNSDRQARGLCPFPGGSQVHEGAMSQVLGGLKPSSEAPEISGCFPLR
jgi:hypothetical protein